LKIAASSGEVSDVAGHDREIVFQPGGGNQAIGHADGDPTPLRVNRQSIRIC
jgi:hypothetical protein